MNNLDRDALEEEDLQDLKNLAFKLLSSITRNAHNTMTRWFPELGLRSDYLISQKVTTLAALQTKHIACCSKGHMAYTGVHEEQDHCIYCQETRYQPDGTLTSSYLYIPIAGLLQSLWQDPILADKLRFRSRIEGHHGRHDHLVGDYMDSARFLNMKNKKVTIDQHTAGKTYCNRLQMVGRH